MSSNSIGHLQFREALEALETQGVVLEACNESPTTWRLVQPMTETGAFPIIEALQLSLPSFQELPLQVRRVGPSASYS